MNQLIKKRPIFLEKNWLKAIFGFWILVLSYSVLEVKYKEFVPVSNWYEIRSVHVGDSEYPNVPNMVVDRKIHKEARGDWVVTVMRKMVDNDEFYLFCTATGSQYYSPDNALPYDLTLDWWTWPTKCHLPPGKYYIITLHIFNPEGYPTKESRIRSNVFEIK